jgi:nucleoside-diphosphate kinase
MSLLIFTGGENVELTFVMLKPSALVRGVVGEIISRFEKKGLKIVAMKLTRMTEEKARELYSIHKGKSFFAELIAYVSSAPIIVMVFEGEDAVKVTRRLVGDTDPKLASPSTIRGDFAMSPAKNIIHAADSCENAQRETSIFFKKNEIFAYLRCDEDWLY